MNSYIAPLSCKLSFYDLSDIMEMAIILYRVLKQVKTRFDAISSILRSAPSSDNQSTDDSQSSRLVSSTIQSTDRNFSCSDSSTSEVGDPFRIGNDNTYLRRFQTSAFYLIDMRIIT